MNRRTFISGCVGLVIAPFSSYSYTPSLQELTGKTSPQLTTSLLHPISKSFTVMKKDALKAGIHLDIISGYRSFSHQRVLWNKKYREFGGDIEQILQFTSIPGTSRHHWGTDVDIYDDSQTLPKDVLDLAHYSIRGRYHSFLSWMENHASSYGFYMPYTNDTKRQGFSYEPWHWSFAPISKKSLNCFLESNWKTIVRDNTIKGNERFSEEFLDNYQRNFLQGINEHLL